MFSIELKREQTSRDETCFLCGGYIPVRPVEASLCHNDRELGIVCEHCIKRGEDEIPELLRQRAMRIREEAEQLMDKAGFLDLLSSEKINGPQWHEYCSFLNAIDRELEEKLNALFDSMQDEQP